MNKTCDQKRCCCPVSDLVIANADDKKAHVRCSFAGVDCSIDGLSLDTTIGMPDGFTSQIRFMNSLILVTLTSDSNKIDLTNPSFSECSETAKTNQGQGSTRINMELMSAFVALVMISQFKM